MLALKGSPRPTDINRGWMLPSVPDHAVTVVAVRRLKPASRSPVNAGSSAPALLTGVAKVMPPPR
jgi:hypothetical protein